MLYVLSASRSSYPPPPSKSHLFFLEVTNYGRLPVEDDYAARMDSLKQTSEVKWVALFVSTQALLLLFKDTGGDVRIVKVRTLTLFLPNPAIRRPKVDPLAYSTFFSRRKSIWQPCTASTTLTQSSHGNTDNAGSWPHSCTTLSGCGSFKKSRRRPP